MARKSFEIIFVLLFIMCSALTAGAVDMEPGQYEITMRMEMEGMPMQMPPTTSLQCLTDEDPSPKVSTAGTDCEITDMKTSGDTITWSMECNARGENVRSQGRVTYNGDTFEGVVTTEMEEDGETMVMRTKMNGERIGDCK